MQKKKKTHKILAHCKYIYFLYIHLTDSSFQKIDNTIQSAEKKKLQNIEKIWQTANITIGVCVAMS